MFHWNSAHYSTLEHFCQTPPTLFATPLFHFIYRCELRIGRQSAAADKRPEWIPKSIINPYSDIDKVIINRRPINVDMFVTVTARVLVDKTKGVAEEVSDHTDLQYTGYCNLLVVNVHARKWRQRVRLEVRGTAWRGPCMRRIYSRSMTTVCYSSQQTLAVE